MRRCIDAGQAVGVHRAVRAQDRAEGIVVVGCRHDHRRGAERGGLLAQAVELGVVVADLAKGDEVVVDVLFDGGEHVAAAQPAQDVALAHGVEAQRTVQGAVLRTGLDAGAVPVRRLAAVLGRLDVEEAGGTGDQGAIAAHGHAADGLEGAPGTGGEAVVEPAVAFERGALDQVAAIHVGG